MSDWRYKCFWEFCILCSNVKSYSMHSVYFWKMVLKLWKKSDCHSNYTNNTVRYLEKNILTKFPIMERNPYTKNMTFLRYEKRNSIGSGGVKYVKNSTFYNWIYIGKNNNFTTKKTAQNMEKDSSDILREIFLK